MKQKLERKTGRSQNPLVVGQVFGSLPRKSRSLKLKDRDNLRNERELTARKLGDMPAHIDEHYHCISGGLFHLESTIS
jgi:hypothetical protein